MAAIDLSLQELTRDRFQAARVPARWNRSEDALSSGNPEQAPQMARKDTVFWRYVAARYQAFTNVIWVWGIHTAGAHASYLLRQHQLGPDSVRPAPSRLETA